MDKLLQLSPFHYSILLVLLQLCITSHGLPSRLVDKLKLPLVRSARNVPSEFEQCFYQSNSAGKLLKTIYGQCMSMNGPEGCCLEGHYKVGICPNLGQLCCTKPDPDCSNMRNNKGMCSISTNIVPGK